MATLPEGITQEQLDRYAQLDRGVKALEEERKLLAGLLKGAFEDAGLTGKRTMVFPSAKYGSVIVTLGEQRNVSRAAKEQMMERFPQGMYPQYWEMQLNVASMPSIVVDPYRETSMTLKVDVEKENPDVSPRRASDA